MGVANALWLALMCWRDPQYLRRSNWLLRMVGRTARPPHNARAQQQREVFMAKSARWSETWFRRGLWLVAVVFASFLIGLGSSVVDASAARGAAAGDR